MQTCTSLLGIQGTFTWLAQSRLSVFSVCVIHTMKLSTHHYHPHYTKGHLTNNTNNPMLYL